MQISNIIQIEDVLVRPEVVNTYFSCDLEKCRGACCTLESEFGAPLLEEEIKIINDILPVVKKYLPQEHAEEIEKNGFYAVKGNELMTHTLEKKACVFVCFENDIAKCSIEKAFNNNEIEFKKPLSCHLFPIRISEFGDKVLRYERFSECDPALKKGIEANTTIAEFCKDSLIRVFGNNWYSSFMKKTGK